MRRRLLIAAVLLATSLLAAACGSKDVELRAEDQGNAQLERGAQIFYNRCQGCHTLDAAASEGSSWGPSSREYKDGPNFNQRKEEYEQVLYAIRNGGFSSGPMPQNIVVGEDAEAVAQFVAKYSGSEIGRAPTPRQEAPQGQPGGESPVQDDN